MKKQFICATQEPCDFSHRVPAPYLRRSFDLRFPPVHAAVRICGLGFYRLWINGTEITKGYFAPYISNPDDRMYYDIYDLAPHLRQGKNVIGVLLGNGFQNDFGGAVWNFDRAAWRSAPKLALEFEAEGCGQTFSFCADERFLTHPSPIRFDEYRLGEIYDAARELPGWNLPDYDASGWAPALPTDAPRGTLCECHAEPIRCYEELKPVSVTPCEDGYLYDFGRNTSGVCRLHLSAASPGQTVVVKFCERLRDGKFDQSNLYNQPVASYPFYYTDFARIEYRAKGGDETYEPSFAWFGYRYAFVLGVTEAQATADLLTYPVLSSRLRRIGQFSCSDPIVNRIQELIVNSDRSNFYYFPTDCPHREKNGWTGDASMSVEHMLLHMAGENSLRVWLANIRKAQNDAGALPGIVPTGGWGFDWGNGPAWDSVLFNLPYQIYRHTGDVSVITENLPAMLRYLAYAVTKRDERGLCAYGLGDWVDPNQDVNGKIAAPLEVTDSVMLTDMATKAAFLFRQAGRRREAEYAAGFAADMREAIRAHLIDFDTMTVAGDCQTSQAFAIGAGIFETEELPAARARLLAILHRDGDENACGMIGLRYLYHVLIDMGEAELAYRVMTSEGRTGYGSWVKRGATSMLENFPYEDGRGVCSQNHHFLADILSVMIQDFAGLRPNPTCDDPCAFVIAPVFLRELDFAEADYRGVCGRLSVRWERRAEEICLTIEVPEGMHGRLLLPPTFRTEGNNILTKGKYIFTIIKE